MSFNYFYMMIMNLFFMFMLIFGSSLEMIFLVWYFISFFLLAKLYSHISYMLLILELITLITLGLMMVLILKTGLEFSFLFLFLCLVVGEASLGLSLMVMSSRFQNTELVSLNLL